METEVNGNDQQGREQHKLELLAGSKFHVTPVESAGYIVHNLESPPNAEGDWVLIDIDDTIAATSLGKEERNKILTEGLGLEDEESSASLIASSDDLARFNNPKTGELEYDVRAHESLVSLVYNEVKKGTSPDEIQRKMEEYSEKWRLGEGKYIANKNVKDAFKKAFIHPRLYADIIGSIKELTDRQKRSAYAPNVGFFTFGKADYQLYKALQIAEICGVNSIWLTETRKGEFFKTLFEMKDNPYSAVTSKAATQDLRMVEDEDISDAMAVPGVNVRRRGIDWTGDRLLMLFDDSVEEIQSVENTQHPRLAIVGKRIRRERTKNYQKEPGVEGIELPNETIDPIMTESSTSETIPTNHDIEIAFALETLKRYQKKDNALARMKFDIAESRLRELGYNVDGLSI